MGRACLVRSLKGLKGFSTRQVVPVLFPTPKRLGRFPAPSCQMAIPRLGTRSWSGASSGRGLHRALALGLGLLRQSDWCSRDWECWAGRSHVSPRLWEDGAARGLSALRLPLFYLDLSWGGTNHSSDSG